jgi:hypothetical protein
MVQQMHGQLLDTTQEYNGETITVCVRYELKNGTHVYREYNIDAQSQTAEVTKPFFNDMRSVFAVGDLEQVKDAVMQVQIYTEELNEIVSISGKTQMQGLLAAIEADCKEGNMTQHQHYHRYQEQVGSLDITWGVDRDQYDGADARSEHIQVYEDCTHTLAYLETLEIQ